jgi:hypothetical protein
MRDNRSGANHTTATDGDSIDDRRTSSNPAIIPDDDSRANDALSANRA